MFNSPDSRISKIVDPLRRLRNFGLLGALGNVTTITASGLVKGGNIYEVSSNRVYTGQRPGSSFFGSKNAMQGFGSTLFLSPVFSGRVRFEFSAEMFAGGAGITEYMLYYGTGAAPAAGAGATGTLVVNAHSLENYSAYGARTSHFVWAEITGLTLGTAYWFDVYQNCTASFDAGQGLTAKVVEF